MLEIIVVVVLITLLVVLAVGGVMHMWIQKNELMCDDCGVKHSGSCTCPECGCYVIDRCCTKCDWNAVGRC
jgi:hypothetical protein